MDEPEVSEVRRGRREPCCIPCPHVRDMPGAITSASDVLARVQELAAADVEVEKQLNRCRGHAVRTTAQDLQELRALEQATQSVADHAYGLADRISYVSESAARLAQKVRQLDDEQVLTGLSSRDRKALERILGSWLVAAGLDEVTPS